MHCPGVHRALHSLGHHARSLGWGYMFREQILGMYKMMASEYEVTIAHVGTVCIYETQILHNKTLS